MGTQNRISKFTIIRVVGLLYVINFFSQQGAGMSPSMHAVGNTG